MTNFEKVGTFMKTFGQEVKSKPSLSTDKINNLRLSLIKEELNELKDAIDQKDLVEIADALTDILYVTYGAGHAFGINLGLTKNSPISKYFFDLCVDAPQYLSLGTFIDPMLSNSLRNFIDYVETIIY